MTISRQRKAIAPRDFNPHLPYGRWRLWLLHTPLFLYFNPHLPYGRWRFAQTWSLRAGVISIHTFLTEGDGEVRGNFLRDTLFQSTPSLRKVTKSAVEGDLGGLHFNPHLPYGRWRILCHTRHPLSDFNPHLPYGRWQWQPMSYADNMRISIHTFLTEGDKLRGNLFSVPFLFQSTPSLRKVTIHFGICDHSKKFQSTPSLRKVTPPLWLLPLASRHFNPHLPYGRWPQKYL